MATTKKTSASRTKKTPAVTLPAPDSPQHQQMLTVLKQFRVVIANMKEHYADVEKTTGVSGAQLWALYAVAQRPGIKVGELASELAIHQSTASNLLDRLSELGHVERRRASGDQLIVTVTLTAQGKRTVDSAPKPAIGMLQSALLSLPRETLQGLQLHLGDLLGALGPKGKTGEATPISTFLGKKDRR